MTCSINLLEVCLIKCEERNSLYEVLKIFESGLTFQFVQNNWSENNKRFSLLKLQKVCLKEFS